MNRRAVNRLHDALDAARAVRHFIDGHTFTSYINDTLVQSAVERQLEIVGEAINAALRDEPSLMVDIPTPRAWVGLRNILIHAYTDIKPEVVWKAAAGEIPELIVKLETLLAAYPTEDER